VTGKRAFDKRVRLEGCVEGESVRMVSRNPRAVRASNEVVADDRRTRARPTERRYINSHSARRYTRVCRGRGRRNDTR